MQPSSVLHIFAVFVCAGAVHNLCSCVFLKFILKIIIATSLTLPFFNCHFLFYFYKSFWRNHRISSCVLDETCFYLLERVLYSVPL